MMTLEHLGLALLGLAVGMAVTAPVAAQQEPKPAGQGKLTVYLGTYTRTTSKGVYRVQLDLATGKLEGLEVAAEVASPSFLAIHPTRPLLYSVGQLPDSAVKKEGGVNAFAIDARTGKLTLLNQQSSKGLGPCHLVVDRSGRCVLVANYGGGNIACLPIRDDGSLGEAACFIQHEGSSVNPKRQQGPHAHSINVDPANRFAFVADLGLDKVMIYRLDPARAMLTPNDPAWGSVPPGGGPRHFAFHPTARWAYVINEMGNTVTVFNYDAARGALDPIQTIPTLPAGFEGNNTTAEVLVHPSGRFVYGSNRGQDSIAAFAVDPQTGKLTWLGNEPSGGKTPRNFNIDPTGRFLLAAHQDSGDVFVLRIDPQTGRLSATGHSVSVPMAVCVKFYQPQ